MSRRSSIHAALVVLASAAAALAQEQPAKPPKDGKGTPRIKIGDDPLPPAEPAKKPEKPETPQKTEPEMLVDLLGTWPSQEARQASIRLRAQPSIAYPLLEKKMLEKNQDWRMIDGAAATLGMIGDLRAVDLIRAKLEDGRMYQHSSELLDALVRIDPAGAKTRLLALLLHPASAVVLEVEKRLEPRVAAVDVDALRDTYDAAGPAGRAAALRLMAKADRAASRADVVKALRDKEPDVANAAAAALASDDSPEALDLTAKSFASPVDRQYAYTIVSLALRAERGGPRTLDDAGIRTLLGGRGLKSLDQLCRASAALLLADEGYYHEVPILDDALDRQVVPVLVETWIGHDFWADMKTVQPLALRRLRRLSGRLDLESPQEWAAWWEQEGAKFKARRVLMDVPPDAARMLVLTVDGQGAPGGEATTIVSSAENLATQLPDQLVLLVPEDDSKVLAKAVSDSGVLKAPESFGAARDQANAVTVTVRVGRRERRSAVRADSSEGADTPTAKLLALVGDLRRRYAWQRYRTAENALDAESFVGAMSGAFAPERSEADRSAALATLIVTAIDDRRGAAFNARALAELEALPNLPESLGAAETDRLLASLGRRTSLDAVATGIVRVLAKSKKAEAEPLVLEFLVAHGSPDARDLATLLLKNARRDQFLAALSDDRPEVRLAAFAAADADTLGADGAAKILKGVDDHDRTVAGEAVRALGRLHVESARPMLDRLAEQPSELRPAAVEALGSLGGRESLSTIMTAYASNDPALRVAAIQGLAAAREPEGLSAIVFAMASDPSNLVREVASRAILDMGTDRAAAELRKLAVDPAQPAGPRARAVAGFASLRGRDAGADLARLVDDPSDEVADEAALALARWRDPAAVPRLLVMLDKERAVPRARQGLESISLESFAQRDPKALADLYGGWWDLTKDRGPKRWLLDALTMDNPEDPGLRAWAEGKASREAVPALIAALRSDKWFVRRAADLALRDLLGRTVGDQEPWSTAGEVDHMADSWEKVWAANLAK